MERKNHPIEKEHHRNQTFIIVFHVNVQGCKIILGLTPTHGDNGHDTDTMKTMGIMELETMQIKRTIGYLDSNKCSMSQYQPYDHMQQQKYINIWIKVTRNKRTSFTFHHQHTLS